MAQDRFAQERDFRWRHGEAAAVPAPGSKAACACSVRHWCPEPGSNRHAPFTEAADFKSAVSTNFTIGAHPWQSGKKPDPGVLHRPCGQCNKKGKQSFPFLTGAGNETCTRRVSRCFPNTFFTEVASEDLNCSLVFSPRQQVRLKKSTDGHRPPLRTPEPHTVRLRPRRTRTHHRPLRSLLVHPPSRVRARFFVAISGCRASMTGSGFAMSCWTSCNDCHPLAPCETAGISGHTETVLRRSPPLMTLPV